MDAASKVTGANSECLEFFQDKWDDPIRPFRKKACN